MSNSEPDQTTNAGLPLPKTVNTNSTCIVCNQKFRIPVELNCGHVGCKGCILGLTECPLCSQKLRFLGWRKRNDLRTHQLQAKFDAVSSSVHTTTLTGSGNDTGKPSTPASASATDPKVCTFDTQFHAVPDRYSPHTPLEPYPFSTQRPSETTSKQVTELPLIDSQVFSNWDTQDDKSEIEPQRGEDKLAFPERTQAQPMDLTFAKVESYRDNAIPNDRAGLALPTSTILPPDLRSPCRVVIKTQLQPMDLTYDGVQADVDMVHRVARGPAFPTFPSLPMDLRVSSKKKATTKDTPGAGRTLPFPSPTFQPNAKVVSPPSEGIVERGTSVLKMPNPTTIHSIVENPTCSKDGQMVSSKVDVGEIIVATPEFPDDDHLLLETEDCVTSLNVNKQKEDEEEDETSDDEYFQPVHPMAKRPRFNSTSNRVPFKQNMDFRSSKNGDVQITKVPIPFSSAIGTPIGIVEQKLVMSREDDCWTLPEIPLEPETLRKFVLCPTRLSPDEIVKLEKFTKLFGGEIRKVLSKDTTHLLINMERNRVSYTYKYLLGIASKKWILSFEWVDACLKKGLILPEEPYETANFKGSDPGPRKSRLTSSDLFHDFYFYVPQDLSGSMVNAFDCKQLLTALGAGVLEDLPLSNIRLLIVGDSNNPGIIYKKWFLKRRWLTVSWDWITECIMSYSLVPLSTDQVLTPGVDGICISQVLVPSPLLTL